MGSEMCIRDREEVDPDAVAVPVARHVQHSAGKRREAAEQGGVAVSSCASSQSIAIGRRNFQRRMQSRITIAADYVTSKPRHASPKWLISPVDGGLIVSLRAWQSP